MSVPLEGIVRPFSDRNIFPAPFTKQGEQGAELVRVPIGFQGSLKTMGYSFSATITAKMGQVHREKPQTSSAAITKAQNDAVG